MTKNTDVPQYDNSDTFLVEGIEQLMKDPPEGSVVRKLTPGACQILYDRFNTENRPFKAFKIARFALDMERDNWGLTGDTVKFSNKMRLRDGQNRLLACVKSGKPFKTHIVFNIDDNLFTVMDRGKNRTPSDALAIMGIPNAGPISSAVRWAELLNSGNVKSRISYEPDDIATMFRQTYSGVSVFLPQARVIHDSAAMGLSLGMIAAFLYTFDTVDPDLARQFGIFWANGSGKSRAAPVKKMRERLINLASTTGRVHDVVQAAMIVLGWNLFMAGRAGRSTDFVWDRKTEDFPTITTSRRASYSPSAR